MIGKADRYIAEIIPPPLDKIISNNNLIDLPPLRLDTYETRRYTTGSKCEILPATYLKSGRVSIDTDGQGYILSAEGTPKWQICGKSIEAIARCIIDNRPDENVVDIMSCWELLITSSLASLGAPRTCALIYKFYTRSEFNVTQIMETEIFTIIAGIFPGLFAKKSDNSFGYLNEGAIVLRTLLEEKAVKLKFLPGYDTAPGKYMSWYKITEASQYLKSRFRYLIGHRRCLSLPLFNPETNNRDSRMDWLVGIATLRGLDVNNMNFLMPEDYSDPDELINYFALSICKTILPTAIFVRTDLLDNETINEMKRLIFPYASLIISTSYIDIGVPDTKLLPPLPYYEILKEFKLDFIKKLNGSILILISKSYLSHIPVIFTVLDSAEKFNSNKEIVRAFIFEQRAQLTELMRNGALALEDIRYFVVYRVISVTTVKYLTSFTKLDYYIYNID